MVSLVETIKAATKPYGNSEVFAEDLAIYMGYNFDPTHPSVRLRRLNLRKPLRDIGVKADIIYRYEDLLPYKNILLSHFDETLAEQCAEFRKLGKKLFFCHTEALWGLPSQVKVFNLCDYIVCCSNKLVEITQSQITSPFTKCVFIPDMAEQGEKVHISSEKESLSVVYCGMGGNSYLAKDLRPIIEKLGMKLTIISEWEDADIKWNRDTYLDIMAEHDIAICPQNVEKQPAKSHVKVITAMSLGLPVICSPNPAYVEIIEQGVNGFVADTPRDWENALMQLKSTLLRKSIGEAALQTSLKYTPHAIAFYWMQLLSQPRTSIALINNTLPQKYMSYGDHILDNLRMTGHTVEEFRYEDVDKLPPGYDYYLFVERRYSPEDISNVSPRILLTREGPEYNTYPHFDAIFHTDAGIAEQCKNRGFVNIYHQPTFNFDQIKEQLQQSPLEERKKHNEQLHSDHINAFYNLLEPETRWQEGRIRDEAHISYSMHHTSVGDSVLDIGSADGWLSLYLAKEGRDISAVDFVKRGMEWTKQHAQRLGVSVDLRYGFLESLEEVFADKKFNCILAYEVLEHVDYRMLPWYLKKLESLLKPNGKVLVSLPMQDLNDNPEHLWSPSEKLIHKVFANKSNYQIQWVEMPNHDVPGDWFISYIKE
jgi:2-polyprenyl-3-methyl-5-hydroxy-6-metoxy-1,4-benzoquinol methylase